MDKAKRKNLIISYLKNSINLRDFNKEIGVDMQAMSDPLLGAMRSDLSVKESGTFLKGEIIAFDKKQQEGLTSMGSDYIETEKRRLTIQASGYESLLADSEIREIIDRWGTSAGILAYETPVSEYKNASFTSLLEFLKGHPEYNSEIQEILTEIETETGLSDELQEFSDTVNSRDEENDRQNNMREELITFMDNSLHTFGTLLQLDAVDSDAIETIRNAAMQSYEIFREKYSKLITELANDPEVFVTSLYPTKTGLDKKVELTPALQEKLEQIEHMIEQIEEKYGNLSRTEDVQEQIRPQEESIRDEVGGEIQAENPNQMQDSQQAAETSWMSRLQSYNDEVDRMPDGAKKKQDVVEVVSNIQKDRGLREDGQKQVENPNNEQR